MMLTYVLRAPRVKKSARNSMMASELKKPYGVKYSQSNFALILLAQAFRKLKIWQ